MIVVVDRKQFTLEVWNPGPGAERAKRVHHCRVAVGMEGFATPKGVYETGPRSRTPDWRAPAWVDPPMVPGQIYHFGSPANPYQAGLISLHGQSRSGVPREGYAIHGTKNEASIPGRASHGCIRVKSNDLLWLYEHLEDNTIVVIV
jgi:lipoprotein-anchoring transpeptidase ErfK/SrfK